ncbi:hypothetical protein PR048_018761 [Dryococelus australis]|uniref:Uncharacterized protein n=1 Tax=Dryococelus australis TaxID=614101 RepID=A0ABQ9HD83_9NEOP|nr:hypothetical protein PR048_018761 [Dryococelus australis]
MVKKKCGDVKSSLHTSINTSKMDGVTSGQVDTQLSGEADWATWKGKLTVLPRATNLLGITSCKVTLTVLPRATNLLGITSCKVKLTQPNAQGN